MRPLRGEGRARPEACYVEDGLGGRAGGEGRLRPGDDPPPHIGQIPLPQATAQAGGGAGDLSPAQVKVYRLADNRSAEETSWNLELLSLELESSLELSYDLELLGFESAELTQLMTKPTEGQTDPDALLEPPLEPTTRTGVLWQLGPHRLLCGDATRPEDVRRLMAGVRAPLMATDPPYLVDYDGGHHPATAGNGGKAGKVYEKEWDTYQDGSNASV